MWRANLDFDQRVAGTRSESKHTLPPSISLLDATNLSPDIVFDRSSTIMSQDNTMAESDGSAKKRVVRSQVPSQEQTNGGITR